MEYERILVTAALPYANGPIHLGHLAGAYLPADIYVRYQRMKGREVLFICGSDEHGVAITLAADAERVPPQTIVDRYHAMNLAAFRRFGMSFDSYSRTSLPLHHDTAREFLLDFHRRGILREKTERQFYDTKAQMFLPDRYVEGTCPVCSAPDARGDQCERCGSYLNPTDLVNPVSKITGEPPELRETVHLYFPLGNYQDRLEEYVRSSDRIEGWKENVLQYCRSWFKDGLQDRAVTRDLPWGVNIPLEGYEGKVIYVWFDAVLGYISSTKEWAAKKGDPSAWERYWLNRRTKYVAFIGKDNVVFHCIVFPAMLMAWNDTHQPSFVLPANVPANEFLNFEGEKFSKSRGWGIDLQEFLDRHPADPLRYYLATALPEYRDSDFTWKDFQARNNNELADIVGNFVNRTLTFAGRTFGGAVPARRSLSPLDEQMVTALKEAPLAAGEHFDHYRFRDGLMTVMNLARAANKYFNDSEPWKTASSDRERCGTAINICVQTARTLAVLLSPVMPESCERIWTMLNLDGEAAGHAWDFAGELLIQDGHRLGAPVILFPKIEDGLIEQELQRLRRPAPPPGPTEAQLISIDEFAKVQLRVATVAACARVPKSDKLLTLQVEIGAERRQILAGIARHYAPEDLVGKSVVVVANLRPATLMGHESQGMLLAASDAEGRLVFVTPAGAVASGSVVK